MATGGLFGTLASRGDSHDTVWQIDPDLCVSCGKCATHCVLEPSAVKCVHEYAKCGYCDLCFGYFADQRVDDQETPENRRCPTNAIRRSFIEDPYYEYIIDEARCIGCGICVEGCAAFGNSSLILQIRHDRCLNCNECAIAVVCPTQAISRISADEPYLLRVKPPQDNDEEQPDEAAGPEYDPFGNGTHDASGAPPDDQWPPADGPGMETDYDMSHPGNDMLNGENMHEPWHGGDYDVLPPSGEPHMSAGDEFL